MGLGGVVTTQLEQVIPSVIQDDLLELRFFYADADNRTPGGLGVSILVGLVVLEAVTKAAGMLRDHINIHDCKRSIWVIASQ